MTFKITNLNLSPINFEDSILQMGESLYIEELRDEHILLGQCGVIAIYKVSPKEIPKDLRESASGLTALLLKGHPSPFRDYH